MKKRVMQLLCLNLALVLSACAAQSEEINKGSSGLFLADSKKQEKIIKEDEMIKQELVVDEDKADTKEVVLDEKEDKQRVEVPKASTKTEEKKDSVSSTKLSQSEASKGDQKAENNQIAENKEEVTIVVESKPAKEEVPQDQPKAEISKPDKSEMVETVAFDVSVYVTYANEYAKSIGLVIDPSATECWDNPISANAGKTSIKADIKSRLDRYKKIEGFSAVYIWTEKISDDAYNIYIGYY